MAVTSQEDAFASGVFSTLGVLIWTAVAFACGYGCRGNI